MGLPKDDAATLSARWTEGVLLKRDVFSTVERGRFLYENDDVEAVLRRLDQVPAWSFVLALHLFSRERRALALARDLNVGPKLLWAGKRALVTSGPTREAIDPVRYISNHSSGKQGNAIAAALARLGAEVTLVSGPVAVADPPGVKVVKIDSADEMLAACLKAGAVDVAVCAAAVADWKAAKPAAAKIKKKPGAAPPSLELAPNPDILATLSRPGPKRPTLVVGFAAETENLVANAIDKRNRKGCDWIIANDVSTATGTFGGERNTVHLISTEGVEDWPTMAKDDVALRLAGRIALQLGRPRPAAAAE